MLLQSVRISFLFKTEKYSFVCVYYILFIISSIDGHLGCVYLLAIVSSPIMNMSVQI